MEKSKKAIIISLSIILIIIVIGVFFFSSHSCTLSQRGTSITPEYSGQETTITPTGTETPITSATIPQSSTTTISPTTTVSSTTATTKVVIPTTHLFTTNSSFLIDFSTGGLVPNRQAVVKMPSRKGDIDEIKKWIGYKLLPDATKNNLIEYALQRPYGAGTLPVEYSIRNNKPNMNTVFVKLFGPVGEEEVTFSGNTWLKFPLYIPVVNPSIYTANASHQPAYNAMAMVSSYLDLFIAMNPYMRWWGFNLTPYAVWYSADKNITTFHAQVTIDTNLHPLSGYMEYGVVSEFKYDYTPSQEEGMKLIDIPDLTTNINVSDSGYFDIYTTDTPTDTHIRKCLWYASGCREKIGPLYFPTDAEYHISLWDINGLVSLKNKYHVVIDTRDSTWNRHVVSNLYRTIFPKLDKQVSPYYPSISDAIDHMYLTPFLQTLFIKLDYFNPGIHLTGVSALCRKNAIGKCRNIVYIFQFDKPLKKFPNDIVADFVNRWGVSRLSIEGNSITISR